MKRATKILINKPIANSEFHVTAKKQINKDT